MTPSALYQCNFCSVTEGVTDQLHLQWSGAEVVPDSLTIYTVPVQEVYRCGKIVDAPIKEVQKVFR